MLWGGVFITPADFRMSVPSVPGPTPAVPVPGLEVFGDREHVGLGILEGPQVPHFSRAPTPVCLGLLLNWFIQKKGDSLYLTEGFTQRFRIPFQGPQMHMMVCNLRSISGKEGIVQDKIKKELELGRLTVPFQVTVCAWSLYGCQLWALCPRRRLVSTGSFITCHPHETSVKDTIDPALCSVRYASFDAAVGMIRDLGPAALLAKCDIKSAFRVLPVFPGDFDLLGFAFEKKKYFDNFLPMGCSISCAAFECFSTFLQ